MTKERDCDIEGCNNKATDIITSQSKTTYCIVMCSFHYRDFYAEESVGKHFNLKDNVFEQHKHSKGCLTLI
jgi:arabinogalactan endo-1,4-beta-galactosidase